jgi:Right handed beta helix region
MMPSKIAAIVFILLMFLRTTVAKDIYVSPAGNDVNTGTIDSPMFSLERAKSLARRFVGNESVTVHVADGVYYLPETLVFESTDSGSEKYPIVYAAENEGRAVLSGGTKLNLAWQPFRNGIFMAKTPAGLTIDQLFVDGLNQRMARYPNYDSSKTTEAYQGFSADAFAKERAARWSNPVGGYIHAMHRSRWGGYHYRITGKNANGEVVYEGGWQNNRQMGMHKDFRMVENLFEELDAPGEWYHDAGQQTLYYMPNKETNLQDATVEVVRLRHLIEFQGTESARVAFITLRGFVIRHAARTFMETKEPLLRSDWAIYRGGAVFLSGTDNVQILDTEFDQVGGNAVFASNYNRRVLVKGCHIHDTGASGVCFVGDPGAVRDPLFEYSQNNDLTKIDRTPGPKSNNYPADSTVEDCLIHGIGRVERQPAGVQIEMAQHITVRDCSIYNCARAGINIGDGAWGGHLIERCDVFDTVQETHDHGSFNSWGRDRYWRSDHLTATQAAVDADPSLPFLDAVETTVIRNSRWRCDHGWDIDLDDGSSNYDIYNNLLLCGGLKFREGFRRQAWNNITVNNGFHPHVWFNHSQDEVFGNIFMAAHRGALMPSEKAKGKRIDENLFFVADAKIKDQFVRFGWDVHSANGDPLFIDPANGDFRVKDGSPAFAIGFKNFPMDQFGVKKPSLKAIARTPVIPKLHLKRDSDQPLSQSPAKSLVQPTSFWLGAELHELVGEEFSAFGVTKNEGGVALTLVPKKSEAAAIGLRQGDLIQSINGQAISGVGRFLQVLAKVGADPLELKIVRDQQAIQKTIVSHSFVTIEAAKDASDFKILSLPNEAAGKIAANQSTSNEPLETLVDGKLTPSYGPVFPNGVHNGAYRIDIGTSKPTYAITSWSYAMDARGRQRVTIYGSNSSTDPGWNLTEFTPLGTMECATPTDGFTAMSLRAPEGRSLGNFRWIVWNVAPISATGGGENSAFQELSVGIR